METGAVTSSKLVVRLGLFRELLAPSDLIFYDRRWRMIGTKSRHAQKISQITGIEERYILNLEDDISDAPIMGG